jgi:hypothetical protein
MDSHKLDSFEIEKLKTGKQNSPLNLIVSTTIMYLSQYLLGLFSQFFSQNFHIIWLSKTTHPIEFLDCSN